MATGRLPAPITATFAERKATRYIVDSGTPTQACVQRHFMTNSSLSADYAASIAYLYDRINYEQVPVVRPRRLNLENMRLLLEHLGNPHTRIPVVHIAGTKGKGSTSSMVASILTKAGYRTGLYTSPHLSCLEERFAVDGVCCSRDALVDLTEQLRPVVSLVDREIQATGSDVTLTFFEITTAIAWLYFVRQQVDIAVLEVGMGGRLDSTNLCNPLVTVITSISFDHTKQLGNTLAAIGEKAGIIKPGVPIVSGVEDPAVKAVVEQSARAARAPLISLGNDFFAGQPDRGNSQETELENRLDYRVIGAGQRRSLGNIELGLLGDHQRRNAAVALAALGCLQDKGWHVAESAIRYGLAQVRCPARIEICRRKPFVVMDTAHNVASIAALVDTLNQQFPGKRRVLLFAASRDKDVRGMLRLLVPQFDEIVLTQFLTNPRAVEPGRLEEIAHEIAQSQSRSRSPRDHNAGIARGRMELLP